MAKKLKIWNGRGAGTKYRNGDIYVAAYSQKHAAEIISEATGAWVTISEIRNYYHADSWGDSMKGIEPTEPCVYASERFTGKPERIY